MYINLFLIPFIIILGLLFIKNDNQKNRLLYVIISLLVFLFVGSMRSPEWFEATYRIDTLVYQRQYEDTAYMDWEEIWQSFLLRYVTNDSDRDVGFMFFYKTFSYITTDFHIFSFLADLLFFIPFGIILYRYTSSIKELIFAFVFYIGLIQIFIFGGARQMFAIGFDLMALLCLLDKKYLWVIVCFIIGLTIHFSSLLFGIPLILIWLKIKPGQLKLFHLISFLLFPLVLAFPNQIIQYLGNLSGIEKYAEYGEQGISGGANTFIFLMELISLFILIAIPKKNLEKNKKIRIFYVMAPLATFMAPLIHSNGSMIRITLYFYLFYCLLIPYAINSNFIKYRNTVYFLAISALSLLSVSGGGIKYYFFWQSLPIYY